MSEAPKREEIPEGGIKNKFLNLNPKDKEVAKRSVEEKGKKWDSADWAMENGENQENKGETKG